MRILKIISLLFILASLTTFEPVHAQYTNTTGLKEGQVMQKKKKSGLADRSRWFVGGMLGGGFSTYSSYAEVAPLIGYKVTPNFHVGSRITYIFQSYKDYYTGQRINLHIYGGSLLARYGLFKFLFVQSEYEILSVPVYPYEGTRTAVNSLFVGGGLMQSSGNGFATVGIFYNVLDNPNSPYSNPLIRIGFGFGL